MSRDTIHKRLAEVHLNLMNMKIEKSGRNNHKGFNYYELEDMLPPILKECAEKEISVEFTYCEGVAILKLVDWNDKRQYIPFRVAMPELVVEEKNPNNKLIQALGANITYLQRYLLKLAFPCLTDKDVIDSDDGSTNDNASSAKNIKKESSAKKSGSKKEPETVREDLNLQELLDKALTKLQKKGLTHEEITAYAVKKQIEKVDKFNKKELNLIYDFVNKHFEKQKGGS